MPPVRRQISPHAAQLRRDMTDVEWKLWFALRDRRLDGFKFRRQASIGDYVVDFLCPEARLVVELDGGQHSEERDARRTAFIEGRGYRVIRFWNNEVNDSFEGVLGMIHAALVAAVPEEERRRPSPNPLPQAGEG
jgi:very-short-patch-repair endonuclease